MERFKLAVMMFGMCVLGFTVLAEADGLADLHYRFEAVDATATPLAPTGVIAVVLNNAGMDANARTAIAALGVDPNRVTSSLLAGTLLIDAADIGGPNARAQLATQILSIPGVDYVAPVSETQNGVKLALAPRVYVSRVSNQNSDALAPSIDLTTANGFEIESLRNRIAATPEISAVTSGWFQVSSIATRYVVPNEPASVTRYLDGTTATLPSETVWREMCGGTHGALSVDQLKTIANSHAQAARAIEEETTGGIAAVTPGLDLRFQILSSLPAGAAAAIAEVEAYLEAQFDDPVVINISLRFAPLGSGVLGSTGSSYLSTTYAAARDALQANMDITDTIQDFLPSTPTLPVRYNGNSETVTNENRVFVTRANYNSYIGTASGSTASMTFNTQFAWDYTPPSISPSTWDFQSVLVHEVGHALGFTSGADFRFNDLETLDLYRFQRSDGDGTNHNPDTLADFQTTPRMVDQNEPLPIDDVNSDLITVEYRMSDGNPRQASHFRDQSPAIGIMDPTIGSAQTFFPNFIRQSDGDMFDAIGWDYPSQNFCRQDAPIRNLTALPGSRYISFIPPDHIETIAIRVKLVSLLNPEGGLPAGSPDLSAFEGEVRWVGAPVESTDSDPQGTTLFAANTSCEPVCLDWIGYDVVHVYGGEIAPNSVYEVQAIRCSCDTSIEKDYSTATSLTTSHWGDITEPFLSEIATIQPDFSDISAIVAKFLEAPGAISKARTQLQPNVLKPEVPVDFKDISADVNAFLDGIYGYTGPCVCPSSVTCGVTSCAVDSDCGTGVCVDSFCTDACGRCTP